MNNGVSSKPQMQSRHHKKVHGEGADRSLYRTIACQILRLKNSPHPTKGREYCKDLYDSVKEGRFAGDVRRTDHFFFKMLGIHYVYRTRLKGGARLR